MSAMNRWALDVAEVSARAEAAAGTSADPWERVAAFRELCGELEERGEQYVCPSEAARALVQVAAYAYAAERMRSRHV